MWLRKLKQGLCTNLEGRGGEGDGREVQKGGDICIPMVMTNLDSILESRDFTLPTKVHLVTAMVFPGVKYGCESWTIKKAECRRNDVFELWCWRRP